MDARQRSLERHLPAPNSGGPFPWNVDMDPGHATTDQMLASSHRGLWVTRFPYVRPLHPVKTVVTGVTRDGMSLIRRVRVPALKIGSFTFASATES